MKSVSSDERNERYIKRIGAQLVGRQGEIYHEKFVHLKLLSIDLK